VLRYVGGLVALQGTDEVPFEVEIDAPIHFWARFLQIIFTKTTLAQCGERPDAVDRLRLAGRHQRHAAEWAPALLHRPAQAIVHRAPAIGQSA
jgi:hypothetical protein